MNQLHHNSHRYDKIFPATLVYSGALILLGLCWDGPITVLRGLFEIMTRQDLLITDYVEIAGVGAALVNAGLVTMISVFVIKLS